MRFLLNHGKAAPTVLGLVRAFLVFCALFLAGFAAQRATQGGLTPAGVGERYLGPADFPEPIPPLALWEEAHVNAFFFGFLLLMLGSLVSAGRVPSGARAALLWLAFTTTLVDLAAPFLIVWAGAPPALRVASFAGALLALAVLCVAAAWGFGERGRG